MAAEAARVPRGLSEVQLMIEGLGTDGGEIARVAPPEEVALAQSYAEARKMADRRLWWLALGLALVAGLGALYIGKPFGTFWDYLSAVSAGVLAVLTLSALNTALEGLPSLREILSSRGIRL